MKPIPDARKTREAIGRRLIQVRLAYGDSQAQFARRLGDRSLQQRISNYERGETGPTVDFLQLISAVGVNVHWLICGSGNTWVRKPRGVRA